MKATVEKARVLIVDDEPAVLRVLTRVMDQRGYRSKTARDGREASELFEAEAFDVVVSDVHMPGYGGIEFLRRVRETDPDLPVIVMTGKPTLESSMKALEYRAFRYLFKPIEANTVAVIAEGVETTGERDALMGLGCDLFQGYLFGRPSREPTPAIF